MPPTASLSKSVQCLVAITLRSQKQSCPLVGPRCLKQLTLDTPNFTVETPLGSYDFTRAGPCKRCFFTNGSLHSMWCWGRQEAQALSTDMNKLCLPLIFPNVPCYTNGLRIQLPLCALAACHIPDAEAAVFAGYYKMV